MKMKLLQFYKLSFLTIVIAGLIFGCAEVKIKEKTLDINAYLEASDGEHIYPSPEQIKMLKSVVPVESFQPAPSVSNRDYWDKIGATKSGQDYLKMAISEVGKEPEVPISDEIYRRANKEGNRRIYKPRYYRTMDRLEKYILGECIEDKGRFLGQIDVYCRAIMEMRSWMHPNHDDNENSVFEGKRVAIDLGARKFGLVLALADALLEEKLPSELRAEIATQLQWRIMDSYFKTCLGEDTVGNHWIRSTSNWNSVCTSGTVFTTIVASKNSDERIAAIGCALNSMAYYLSGFGEDGYCSEGTGYWNYGFGHYLYLAEIIDDYTNGKINLFDFNNAEKLNRVANFPENFQIHQGLYAPFSDGVTRVNDGSNNFAYLMASKYYGARKPVTFIPDESVQTIVGWSGAEAYVAGIGGESHLPEYTYFDDYGIVVSRGQQKTPFSIAIKAGHNAENHNHSDVGSYVIVLGDDIVTGDIGAPSYIAGAFSPDNPARSSWGHPVPMIDRKLQSNGKDFSGRIISTEFSHEGDKVEIDIKSVYKIPSLTSLVRTMVNDKSGEGTITIEDRFTSTQPVAFGVAIMTLYEYEIVDDNTVILTNENQKVKARISGKGAEIKIIDELVPVEHLREGGPAHRIGIDFTEPIKEGFITVEYIPILK